MRIDQVLPAFVERDAIGNHTRHIRETLLGVGIDSDIYYLNASSEAMGISKHISELTMASDDRYLLYHSSIGSPVVDQLLDQRDPIIIDYHNITPARFFEKWIPGTGNETLLGRRQLSQLVAKSVLGLADSAYNERELIDVGYRPTAVAPLLIDIDRDPPVNSELLEQRSEERSKRDAPSLMFVGTLSPHKAPHELVAMLAAYRTLYNPRATLDLVGRPFGGRYLGALHGYIHALGLDDAVNIAGSISSADLEAYWRTTDVFVCASNHEGFCVPIIEAMGHDVPVVAYGAAAVPETVGGAGFVIPDKAPIPFAAAIHRVVIDEALRRQFNRAAVVQRTQYELANSSKKFLEVLLTGLDQSAQYRAETT